MAHSKCWGDNHILNAPGWLYGRIFCLGHPRGEFAVHRQLQRLIGSVVGSFKGDAFGSEQDTTLPG